MAWSWRSPITRSPRTVWRGAACRSRRRWAAADRSVPVRRHRSERPAPSAVTPQSAGNAQPRHHRHRATLAGLKWSSQHVEGGVAMTRRRRRSDRSGRAPLFSPGRPVVAGRDERRRFWAAIAAGMASEDAAVQVGMSQAVGTRLFREAGGMPPAMFRPSAKPLSGRYLSFAEREEIALLRVQGCSMREVGRRLGRTASTISRELAAQRCDPKRQPGVSRDDSAMACRAICSPPKAGQACAQCDIANLCGGTIGRRRRRSGWGSCSRPGCTLERPPAWTAEASAVGKRLEPGADCLPLAGRLPGR